MLWLAGVAVGATLLVSPQAFSARQDDTLSIHIWKERHELWLLEGDRIERTFQIALGKQPEASKEQRGDGRTPEGTYYICAKRAHSRFHRFLGISYPNIDDAEKGFADRLINADQWADIFFANLRQITPPWSTALGGGVGIHGYGGTGPVHFDWTKGCIAVSDADIDYLYDRVPLGTRVIISD